MFSNKIFQFIVLSLYMSVGLFSLTIARVHEFLLWVARWEIKSQPRLCLCYDLLFKAAKHNKDRTDRPKTFPILSPSALPPSPQFFVIWECGERSIMKGTGEEEGRVHRSGSIATRGMKVKVRETWTPLSSTIKSEVVRVWSSLVLD